jgi:hypothetical protein
VDLLAIFNPSADHFSPGSLFSTRVDYEWLLFDFIEAPLGSVKTEQQQAAEQRSSFLS